MVNSAREIAELMTDKAKTSGPGAETGEGKAAPRPTGAGGGAAPLSSPSPSQSPSIDEFAHVRSPRVRHPLLAAAAAALAFYLVFHIQKDIRYALSPTEPLDLGEARVTFSGAVSLSGVDNRYVRVRGTPDRESGLELDTKGSWVFTQLFRVLGTGDRLFVHRRENPLPAVRAEDDVFEGRLIRFGDLSFESAIRGYFSHHVSATHFFSPPELARARAAHPDGPLALRDLTGDAVTVAPDAGLGFDLVRPDEVSVGLPRNRYPTEAAARAALVERGGEVLSAHGLVRAEPPRGMPDSGPLAMGGGAPPLERWVFVARFPADKRDAALSALGELDRKVEIRDARATVRARLADVRADDAGATLLVKPIADAAGTSAAAMPIPVASIAAARTLATVQIPDDAYLVIESDHPRDHLPTVFMGLVLAMFGAVNVVGLLKELRR
jgi:hypothetical protein